MDTWAAPDPADAPSSLVHFSKAASCSSCFYFNELCISRRDGEMSVRNSRLTSCGFQRIFNLIWMYVAFLHWTFISLGFYFQKICSQCSAGSALDRVWTSSDPVLDRGWLGFPAALATAHLSPLLLSDWCLTVFFSISTRGSMNPNLWMRRRSAAAQTSTKTAAGTRMRSSEPRPDRPGLGRKEPLESDRDGRQVLLSNFYSVTETQLKTGVMSAKLVHRYCCTCSHGQVKGHSSVINTAVGLNTALLALVMVEWIIAQLPDVFRERDVDFTQNGIK